jgi:CRP/FNR family transcriptional regulator, cyclic AMP receptor protein
MKKRYFKKGAEIIKEGTLSDCAYIIESGSVQVSKILSNGEEQVIGVLEENDIFGEMSLIDGLPRSATVLALEDCTISVMTPEVFNSLSKGNPEALMPILKVLASRLRKALNILEQAEGQKTLIQSVPAEG